MSAPRVRVRGIYATALTAACLDAGFDVVQASEPIRERFDVAFANAPADVAVETTSDRQGVGLSGDPAGVAAVRERCVGVGRDALDWDDRVPAGAVFDARVEETTGGGAILDLGDGREAYLPFDAADGYVDVGDARRVQVRSPAPPWRDGRATVATALRTPGVGSVADLEEGDALVAATPDGTAEHELVQTTELLNVDVPERWAIRWGRAAEGASLEELRDALKAAVERASEMGAALDDAGEVAEPREVYRPTETAWVWFGRESRFALDDLRAAVTATMPGHHRTKAATHAASTAVDFAEAVGVDAEEFPFAAVSSAFGPREGDSLAIEHGKPSGRLVTLGSGTVTSCAPDEGTLTLEREMHPGGTYDALGTEREAGDVAVTRFEEGREWYATGYKAADGTSKGTYVNVSTPVELFPDAIRYVDLHVDVVKYPGGGVEVVDEDELEASVEAGDVPRALADRALAVAKRLAKGLRD
ncbi:DUF402 domain-containing protein [Halarchaeum sp. CBA1220]|uniref:DUF402 domain-containing protein n=1 Tax=Halarchaeum sp. CBA1220 TaxID=1853682 RepID=UPI000F3A93F6|nr:DUF402 domain-containing protein [Halarchaeum sp. CBA1220]QLC33613.1 DUF402 domain-containing protein [Halarchaeum sp. CBA1220]